MIDVEAERRRLAELVAIPGISAKAFPPDEVRRSAEAVAETMVEYGLTGVRLLETAVASSELRVARAASSDSCGAAAIPRSTAS